MESYSHWGMFPVVFRVIQETVAWSNRRGSVKDAERWAQRLTEADPSYDSKYLHG